MPFVPTATLSPKNDEGTYATAAHTFPRFLLPESVAPWWAHPFPPAAGTKGITHYTFKLKAVFQQGCSCPYWMTQSKRERETGSWAKLGFNGIEKPGRFPFEMAGMGGAKGKTTFECVFGYE